MSLGNPENYKRQSEGAEEKYDRVLRPVYRAGGGATRVGFIASGIRELKDAEKGSMLFFSCDVLVCRRCSECVIPHADRIAASCRVPCIPSDPDGAHPVRFFEPTNGELSLVRPLTAWKAPPPCGVHAANAGASDILLADSLSSPEHTSGTGHELNCAASLVEAKENEKTKKSEWKTIFEMHT